MEKDIIYNKSFVLIDEIADESRFFKFIV